MSGSRRAPANSVADGGMALTHVATPNLEDALKTLHAGRPVAAAVHSTVTSAADASSARHCTLLAGAETTKSRTDEHSHEKSD